MFGFWKSGVTIYQVKDLADRVYRKHGLDKEFQALAPADLDGICDCWLIAREIDWMSLRYSSRSLK